MSPNRLADLDVTHPHQVYVSEVLRLLVTIDKDKGEFPTRNSVFEEIQSAGLQLSEMAVDLVYLALAGFSADVRVPYNSAQDRWTREMEVYLPVSDLKSWKKVTPTVCCRGAK